MPQISAFFGIVINMFYDEHNPPHFHAQYGEYKCCIDIRTLTVMQGGLPPRALGLVIEWAVLHARELTDNWNLLEQYKPLNKIKPLQ
ncbi:MAG: DUF4160 domain-containing protein [Kiritimatiellaeota bacterium]|nr:DUF4160 domain-containing protein [Kiritimatiellota bacterium]